MSRAIKFDHQSKLLKTVKEAIKKEAVFQSNHLPDTKSFFGGDGLEMARKVMLKSRIEYIVFDPPKVWKNVPLKEFDGEV
jgi:hypothetical protein